MDIESSYNSSFLYSSLIDDHDPDSQDKASISEEGNSSTLGPELRNNKRKRPRTAFNESQTFNPKKFFVKEPKYGQDTDFFISPAALNSNTTLEDVLITKLNIFNQPFEITAINEQCEIFTNDRGTTKLCIDGCLYIKNMKSGNTCYWQCVQKNMKNCHGCAVTYVKDDQHYLKRIRREHSHEPIAKNTRGFSMIYEMQLKNLKDNLSDCRFTKNRWGNPKLVVEGYFYNRSSTKIKTFYWKCEQRGQCEGYIVTHVNPDGTHTMSHMLKEHSHKPRTETELKEIRLSYIPKFSQSQIDQINKSALEPIKPSTPQHIINSAVEKIQKSKAVTITSTNKSFQQINMQANVKKPVNSISKGPPPLIIRHSIQPVNKSVGQFAKKTINHTISKPLPKLAPRPAVTSSPQLPRLAPRPILPKLAPNPVVENNSQIAITTTIKVTSEVPNLQPQQSVMQSKKPQSKPKPEPKPKIKHNFKKITVGEKCEFVFLIDGIFKMLLNGYAFEINDKVIESSFHWNCSGQSGKFVECSSTAETIMFEGEHFLKNLHEQHNHPPCEDEAEESDGEDNEEVEIDDIPVDEISNDEKSAMQKSNNKIDPLGEENHIPDEDENLTIETTRIFEENEGKCDFIITKRGLPKLTREGYYYVRNSQNKNRSEITYWKCELKGRCTGTLVTITEPDGYYVKSSKEHTHPPDPNKYNDQQLEDKINEENLNNEMKDKTNDEDDDDSEADELPVIPIESENIHKNEDSQNGSSTQFQSDQDDPLSNDTRQKFKKSVKIFAKHADIKCQLITTTRGMPKIARNGYYYCKSSVNKNRQEITYWKCELKGQCKGFLITLTKNDGYYFKSERTHTHPANPTKYGVIKQVVATTSTTNNKRPRSNTVTSSNSHNNVPKISSVQQKVVKTYQPHTFNPLDVSSNNYDKPGGSSSGNNTNYINNVQLVNEIPIVNNQLINNQLINNQLVNENESSQEENCKFTIPEGGDPNETYECEFIISCQGNPKLCLNGYMYTKNRDKNTNFYWNCEIKKSRGCMGYCVTEVKNGKHCVKKVRAHNHPADLEREMISKKINYILQKIYSTPLTFPRKIIDEELAKLPVNVRQLMPKAYSIQRMVKRKVQDKVSDPTQSILNGCYAPVPQSDNSTPKQPQVRNQNTDKRYSESVQIAQYNDEYNFTNLYSSNDLNNSNNYNMNQRYNTDSNLMNSSYSNNTFSQIKIKSEKVDTDELDYTDYTMQDEVEQEQFQDFPLEIKNEPIDDYGTENLQPVSMDYSYQGMSNYTDNGNSNGWVMNVHESGGFNGVNNEYENSNNVQPAPVIAPARTPPPTKSNSEFQEKFPYKTRPENPQASIKKKNQIAKKRIRAPERMT